MARRRAFSDGCASALRDVVAKRGEFSIASRNQRPLFLRQCIIVVRQRGHLGQLTAQQITDVATYVTQKITKNNK